jgi:alkylation response protein AidB-like acyl-CoA dehydrogenase
VLGAADALAWKPLPGADVSRLRRAWQVGTAAETAGCLGAALDSVLDHVKERRQFGRPLGSLQAVQHRLAECATLVEGAKWLALKAADTGTPLDAATAAGFAQGIAKKVAYDLHQFMGAMGLTLEHPLHRWTYRTKLLSSDLGGTDRHMITVAEAAWPAPTLNATQESTQ